MNGRDATVALSQRDAALDRDFVLSIDAARPRRAAGLDRAGRRRRGRDRRRVRAEASSRIDAGRHHLPRRSLRLDGGDVDRGSAQRAAALPALDDSWLPLQHRRLRRRRYESLFPESRSYDEASLAEASTHVAALDADLGGTEILPALKFVLEQRAGQRACRVRSSS